MDIKDLNLLFYIDNRNPAFQQIFYFTLRA